MHLLIAYYNFPLSSQNDTIHSQEIDHDTISFQNWHSNSSNISIRTYDQSLNYFFRSLNILTLSRNEVKLNALFSISSQRSYLQVIFLDSTVHSRHRPSNPYPTRVVSLQVYLSVLTFDNLHSEVKAHRRVLTCTFSSINSITISEISRRIFLPYLRTFLSSAIFPSHNR